MNEGININHTIAFELKPSIIIFAVGLWAGYKFYKFLSDTASKEPEIVVNATQV